VQYLAELSEWLALEAEPERMRLAQALEADDIGTYHAAALELFLTSFFRSRGWSIERHRRIEGTERTRDFLLSRDARSFYADGPSRRGPRRPGGGD
jgi:hypothetical protein